MKTYTETIKIPHRQLDFWNKCLCDKGFFKAQGFGDKEAAVFWTATFPDGMFADVKVCPNSEDIWCECVLFDENGGQVAFSEPCFEDVLQGHWEFTTGDANYIVVVEEGEEG